MATSCPDIPREQWSSHPHWPSQVLLLGSHANFRRISSYLVELAEADLEAESSRSLTTIASLYLRWISAMRSHEAYEEHKLYPYLGARWGLSMAEAEAGHHELHERHAAVVDAIARLAELDTESEASHLRTARQTLVAALQAHDRTLDAHLEVEEQLVIPPLLSLEPEEFHRYTNLSIEALLAELDA